MTDELQNQQAPVGGVVTPPAGELNPTAPAAPSEPQAPVNAEVPPQPPVDNANIEPGSEQFAEKQETAPENVASDNEQAAQEVPAVEPAKLTYMGKEILEKTETVTGDGRLCKLADGTTAFVPLSILGEK